MSIFKSISLVLLGLTLGWVGLTRADERGSFKISHIDQLKKFDQKFNQAVVNPATGKRHIVIALGWNDYKDESGKIENDNPAMIAQIHFTLNDLDFVQTKKPTQDSNLEYWESRDRMTQVTIADPYRSDVAPESELGQKFIAETNSAAYRALFTPHTVFIYLGHNRDQGGSLSFSPPIMSSNGHVNYNAYSKNQGLQKLIQAANGQGPAMIALFSCDSARNIGIGTKSASADHHYSEAMKKIGKKILHSYPKTFFLTTGRISFANENMQNAMGLVTAVTRKTPLSEMEIHFQYSDVTKTLNYSTENAYLWLTPPKKN